jgi:hypothetical protein
MSQMKRIADRATVLMASLMPQLSAEDLSQEKRQELRDAMVKACVKTAHLIEREVHLRFGDSDADADSDDHKRYQSA